MSIEQIITDATDEIILKLDEKMLIWTTANRIIAVAVEKATADLRSRIAYDQERYDALLLAHIQSKIDGAKAKQL